MHDESRLIEAVETLRAEIDELDENDLESREKLDRCPGPPNLSVCRSDPNILKR
jgi:hypothetical protein